MTTPVQNRTDIIEKIKKYCAYQERSALEVTLKLKTHKLSDTEIKSVIRQLSAEDFLNEERFIHSFINGKLKTKRWGRLKLRNHLLQKGISPQLIHKFLGDIEKETYQQSLKETVDKWKRLHELTRDSYPRLVRHLLAKGYEYDLIMKELKIEN